MFRKWKKGGNVDMQREKLKDDLYAFKKTIKHGFPHRPSALAYDSKLKLMAIGNKFGEIKVFGAPGVEFSGTHAGNHQVVQLHFLHGQGKIVSVLDDNSLHLWCLEGSKAQNLKWNKSAQLPGRPGTNQITIVTISSNNQSMWVGSEGGTLHKISLPNLSLMENSNVHQDQIIQSLTDNFKTGKTLGSVEAIAEHPKNSSLVLIGYNRGLIALWNEATKNVEQFFSNEKTLESLSWNSNCNEFMSAHSDGYLCNWRLDSSSPHNSYAPYGPFPCKPISKAMWKSSRSHPFVIFNGGMPRANYGDRHCVSVVQDSKHVTFDFTSRIIDYFVICKNPKSHDWEEPEFIIVLAEEELVVIDLIQEDWPSLTPPYLASPHASAITCCEHVYGVSDAVFQKILTASQSSKQSKSNAEWPINGGRNLSDAIRPADNKSLLLTGHEDGTVKIWEVSGIAMWPVLKVQTSTVFVMESGAEEGDDAYGEEFPPFRKIGEFDPYSDDPRLAVRKVTMCPVNGTIVAGGTAGQVIVLSLSQDAIETIVHCTTVDMLAGRTDFTWKGHEKLDLKTGHISMKPGYQVTSVLQCEPPASTTSLSLNANWGVVGVGTSHGFGLFDYLQNGMVVSRCTLEAGEQLALEGNFSRVRSLKMTIRQSMRRISGSFRGGRNASRRASGRRKYRGGDMSKKLQEANAALVDEEEPQGGWSPATTGQRRVEARSVDDGMTGMVRCTYFAETYITAAVGSQPAFLAGTNSGSVYCYSLAIPEYSKRQDIPVSYTTGKLIQLKHRAPVIDITIVDGDDNPCTRPSVPVPSCQSRYNGGANNQSDQQRNNKQQQQQQNRSSPGSSSHTLIISSEEQVKTFSIPKFTPKRKIKITAIDGSHIRKVKLARFESKDASYGEYNLVCLTNIGELHMFAQLQSLRLQQTVSCMGRDNVSAIASTLLTTDAQGLYQSSQSEFERFSLTPSSCLEAICRATPTHVDDTLKGSAAVFNGDNGGGAGEPNNLMVPPDESVVTVSLSASEDRSTPSSVDVNRRRSPSRSNKKSFNQSSPKTPLLCDHDDDEEDDDDHVNKHESVLEEIERTLAQVTANDDAESDEDDDDDDDNDDDGGSAHSSQPVVDVEVLNGTVAEAERILDESKGDSE